MKRKWLSGKTSVSTILCSKQGLIPASAEFGRRWEQIRRALQLWVTSSDKCVTSARTELPPLLAELAWHGGSCWPRENITSKERGRLLRSCILLGICQHPNQKSLLCECRTCLWISSEFKVTWDAVLKTWPGRKQSTAGCRHSLHLWRTAPMETEAS